MASHWRPVGAALTPRYTAKTIPTPGTVIAWLETRQAWRVRQIDPIHQANWDPNTVTVWEKAGSPDPATWPGRERRLMVEPARNPAANGKDRRGLRLAPWWHGEQWVPLMDPYPTCIECGGLWTCACYDRNLEADAAMRELERLGKILPGCCWACNEPVTGRHHSIVFDGENLLLPGGGDVVFHTSHSRKPQTPDNRHAGTCRQQAEAYEARWVVADAPETRAVRLRCSGTLFLHFGYRECTTGLLCPGEGAGHSGGLEHCTTRWFVSVDGRSGSMYPSAGLVQLVPPTRCAGLGCQGHRLTDNQPAEAEDNRA
jgi:hypothetical protein